MVRVYCNGKVFEQVRAIIFDKDGTLSDSQNFLIHLAQQRADLIERRIPTLRDAVLKAFGVNDSRMNLAGLMAVGTRVENEIAIAALLAQTGIEWVEAKTIVKHAFLEADRQLPRKADLTPPFPGVAGLLASCQSVKVGILSSDTEENVRDFVDRYHLAPYFQLQMGARAGLSKPNPQLLEMACVALRVSPAHTIVIGDAIADIQLAHSGGAIGCIGVTWGGVSPQQLPNADAIANHVSEIQLSDV